MVEEICMDALKWGAKQMMLNRVKYTLLRNTEMCE